MGTLEDMFQQVARANQAAVPRDNVDDLVGRYPAGTESDPNVNPEFRAMLQHLNRAAGVSDAPAPSSTLDRLVQYYSR